LAVLTLLILLIGTLAPDRSFMALAFERSGFYFVFVAFGVWLLTLLRGFDKTACLNFCRAHWPACLLTLALTTALFLTSPPKFRILFDEANLAAVSMDMYERHGAAIPENGFFAGGAFRYLSTTLDKRPLAFPFLTYVAHALSGYRTGNGFVVNFLASIGALLSLSLLLRRWLDPAAGALGQLILASFPLYALCATSNGFELLNLFFILLVFLFFDELLRERSAVNADKCLLTLLVLAQCRYESLLFLVLAPLILLALPRDERGRLSILTLFSPVLLLPVMWQQILFFRAEDHQLDAGGALFGVGHFFTNASRALEALCGAGVWGGFSAPVFCLALAGTVWSLRDGLKQGWLRLPPARYLLAAVFGGFGLVTVVQFGYHLGDLTAPITQRLGLALLPLLVAPAAYCLSRLGQRLGWPVRYFAASCLALLVFFWPQAGKNQAVGQLNAFRGHERTLTYLAERYPGKDVLLIAERAHPYLIHGYSAVNFHFASANFSALVGQMRTHAFQEALAVQVVPYGGGPLPPDFRLTDQNGREVPLLTLRQEQLDPRKLLRVSRVLFE
jgi:hypothetical protein